MMLWKKLGPFLKPSSGIGRGHGRRKGKGNGAKAQAQTATKSQTQAQTYNLVQSNINASSPTAIDELRAMQSRGEIPQRIIGTSEQREKLYEEFARIYGDPPGVLNEYRLKPVFANRNDLMRIEFTTDKVTLGGIAVDDVKYIRKGQASELSKRGQVTHMILRARTSAEIAASYRMSGWPNRDFIDKYGSRVLNDKQKAQVQREIDDYLTSIFKSPITNASKNFAEDIVWRKVPGGWTRSQELSPPE